MADLEIESHVISMLNGFTPATRFFVKEVL